jgi:hypothetical protein
MNKQLKIEILKAIQTGSLSKSERNNQIRWEKAFLLCQVRGETIFGFSL